jgi:heptosyltransferase-2
VTSSLVIQTSFLGDTILTTPLIAELARRGPVDVVTTPASAGLLANHPGIRAVVPYDKRESDGGVRGFLRLARRLRGFSYDVAFLAQGSWRSAALAIAAGVSRRVGFTTSAGRPLYTDRVAYRDDLHHAKPGSVPTSSERRPRLYPGIPERGAVDRFLALHGALDGSPLVALAPGSVWATKRWPYFADLARDLAVNSRIVVVGSRDDEGLAREICAGIGKNALNATGVLTLLGSAELIRRCHGTPTVTIFGPTVPAFGFGPLAEPSATMGISPEVLTCRPCDRHGPRKCPLGHWKCMRDLTPGDVAARVRDILSIRYDQ